jgi:hypothetical protein
MIRNGRLADEGQKGGQLEIGHNDHERVTSRFASIDLSGNGHARQTGLYDYTEIFTISRPFGTSSFRVPPPIT